jgi:hypothetical protein
MICGPNDTWCKAGMSKYFKITPKPFSATLARNPLQVQMENQHLQLYNADLKYTQAIDYVFFMGKIKEYPILSEMILERCYQYLLDQNKGKYKEKNAQKLINQFLQQY